MYWRTYFEALIYISAVFLLGFASGVILIAWIAWERGSRLRNEIVLLRRRIKKLESEVEFKATQTEQTEYRREEAA